MRKLIVPSFVSLDGVLQAPGRPKEITQERSNTAAETKEFYVPALPRKLQIESYPSFVPCAKPAMPKDVDTIAN